MPDEEFEEIAHFGGKISFSIWINPDGTKAGSFGYIKQSDAGGGKIINIYATPDGFPMITQKNAFSWEDDPGNSPVNNGLYPVYIASDKEGLFGAECPVCKVYWRTEGGLKMFCPSCGVMGDRHEFLTDKQRDYVVYYCSAIHECITDHVHGVFEIDMDKAAQEANKGQKPFFYYSEERQQNKFTCRNCSQTSDIFGRFGYCPACCKRNDLQELIEKIIPSIKQRIAQHNQNESCLNDLVSAFDSFARRLIGQMTARIPMTPARKNKFKKVVFSDINNAREKILEVFGIDLFSQINQNNILFLIKAFHRRHIHEHNGSIVDQKYIDDSGDDSFRVGQFVRENTEDVWTLLNLIIKLSENIQDGFHSIFPPYDGN